MKRRMKLLLIPSLSVTTVAGLAFLIRLGYAADWAGFRDYTGHAFDKPRTFTRCLGRFSLPRAIILVLRLQVIRYKISSQSYGSRS